MYDEVVAALESGPSVRRLEQSVFDRLAGFFRLRIEELLTTSARKHPLGFTYAADKLSAAMSVRYHLWPADWSVPEAALAADLHDHSYQLNSLVVGGALMHETFRTDPDREGAFEVLEVEYQDGTSVLRHTGHLLKLLEETRETHEAGTAYRLQVGQIHRVRAIRQPCATLVLTIMPTIVHAPRVLTPAGTASPGLNARPLLTAQEIAEARGALSDLFD